MTAQKKAAGPWRGEAAQLKKLNPNNTSASNARAIILEALRTGPQTTVALRHEHGVMSPAPRVLELRERGYQIDTVRVHAATPDGVNHRSVALYVMKPKGHDNAESGADHGTI
ncbi:MAG: helix-turn-helix domain-containing protein [Burkholderiales bacterium]|nr:helix-turn-helix domain-containing protein [Burkholderiales bacterium]